MGARRKQTPVSDQVPESIEAAPRLGPAPPDSELVGGVNQALTAQRLQLEAAFAAEEPDVSRYPAGLRLAIILGGSAGLWVIAAGAVHLLLTL